MAYRDKLWLIWLASQKERSETSGATFIQKHDGMSHHEWQLVTPLAELGLAVRTVKRRRVRTIGLAHYFPWNSFSVVTSQLLGVVVGLRRRFLDNSTEAFVDFFFFFFA